MYQISKFCQGKFLVSQKYFVARFVSASCGRDFFLFGEENSVSDFGIFQDFLRLCERVSLQPADPSRLRAAKNIFSEPRQRTVKILQLSPHCDCGSRGALDYLERLSCRDRHGHCRRRSGLEHPNDAAHERRRDVGCHAQSRRLRVQIGPGRGCRGSRGLKL